MFTFSKLGISPSAEGDQGAALDLPGAFQESPLDPKPF